MPWSKNSGENRLHCAATRAHHFARVGRRFTTGPFSHSRNPPELNLSAPAFQRSWHSPPEQPSRKYGSPSFRRLLRVSLRRFVGP
jgi:hypothetical protein